MPSPLGQKRVEIEVYDAAILNIGRELRTMIFE